MLYVSFTLLIGMVSYAYDEVRQQPPPTSSLLYSCIAGAQEKFVQCLDQLTSDQSVEGVPSGLNEAAVGGKESPTDPNFSKIDRLLCLVELQGMQIEAQGKQIEAILASQNLSRETQTALQTPSQPTLDSEDKQM